MIRLLLDNDGVSVGGAYGNPAAIAAAGLIALDAVAIDRHGTAARTGRLSIQRLLTGDEQAAAGDRQTLIEGLIEHDRIRGDNAGAKAQMADAGAFAGGEVADDEVMVHIVVVATGMQRYAAAGAVDAAVLGDMVVLDAQIIVLGIHVDLYPRFRRRFKHQVRMTRTDAAAVKTLVAADAVVADHQVVGVTVDQNRTALIGAVDRKAVNPGAVERAVGCTQHDDGGAEFGIERVGWVLARQQVELCGQARGDISLPGAQFIGRHLDRVDARAGSGVARNAGAAPLQPHILMEDNQLIVDAGGHQDQGAVGCTVNGRLDGTWTGTCDPNRG